MLTVIRADPAQTSSPPAQATRPGAKAYLAPARPLIAFITASQTPRKLQLCAVAIAACTALFWLTVSSKLAQSTHSLELIGNETAPSIIAASGIGANLAAAHRHAVDAMLSAGGDVTKCWMQYEADIAAASDRLVYAAQTVSSNPEAHAPVVRIVQKLSEYTALMGQARLLKSAERNVVVEQADRLLHAEILPAVEQLDQSNIKRLNSEYQDFSSNATWDSCCTLVIGLLVLGALLHTQLYLHQHFRRLFNLPLVLATFLLCSFLICIVNTLALSHNHLRAAKVDAFDSVYVLWKARAVAQDAHANQALYLLTQNRHDYEAAFFSKLNVLVNGPVTDGMINNIEQHIPASMGGLLGSEVGNITFSGERQSVVDTLRGYRQYLVTDSKMRDLEVADKHAEAVNLCLTDGSFSDFDRGMKTTLEINEREFSSSVEQGFKNLSGLSLLAGATALSIVALSWLGLRPRINEYRT